MRILVVEDEGTLAQSIKTGLIDEKFAVDVLMSGKDAYEQASVEDYDVVILDWMLPDMDGITVCKKLREEKRLMPIIMLTAKDTIEDKINGLDAGADDYLTKPFNFTELLARIRSVIRRSTTKEPLLTVDSLVLNPATHVVTRAGQEIHLTAKEYQLLEYFMRYPNQVLTREQIMSHVWDYSYDSLSNIVEVLMRRLRIKIDRSFPSEKQLFATIRGLGYRIGAA